MYNFKNNFVIFLFLLLSGCAANVKEVIHNPVNKVDVAFKDVFYLDISHSKSIPKSKDLTSSIQTLNELISKKHNGSLTILSNVKDKVNNGVQVNISIQNFRYVSGFGRFMAGVMVGDAALMIKIRMIEISSGKVIGESHFDTQSDFGDGIFGATTSRQLDAMAVKVVQYMNLIKNS